MSNQNACWGREICSARENAFVGGLAMFCSAENVFMESMKIPRGNAGEALFSVDQNSSERKRKAIIPRPFERNAHQH